MSKEAMKDAAEAISALREWIEAVPDDVQLPAMPGVDADWLDQVESKLKTALAEQPALVQDEAWKAQQKENADYAIKCATDVLEKVTAQQQEPVAWECDVLQIDGTWKKEIGYVEPPEDGVNYAIKNKRALTYCDESPPAQRKPLTEKEIREWWLSENGLEDCEMCKLDDFEKVVRAVEAAHNIKEQP